MEDPFSQEDRSLRKCVAAILCQKDAAALARNGTSLDATRALMSAEECADKLIDHFSSLYDGWSKDLCRYRKGWKKKDYGISRFKYEGYQIEELVL